MTVASTTTKTIVLGPGGGPFSYSFMIPTSADVTVVHTSALGITTTLTSSQYTITGIGVGSGTVTLTGTPLVSGETLTILRNVAYLQPTSLTNQGANYPTVVEAALDRLTMEIQQISEQSGRVLTGPVSDTTAMTALPGAAARAGNVLMFDASGNPTVGSVTSSSGYLTSAAMAPVTGAATLAAGRTALGLGALATEGLGKGLVDNGASGARVQFITESKAVSYTVASTDHMEQYLVTGPVVFTLPLTTGLWNGFGFWANVTSAALFLAPNAADSIDGGTTGELSFIPAGSKAFIFTNATGAWVTQVWSTNNSATAPGGYLTARSGYTVYPGDITSATTLYYTPDVHGLVPIYTPSGTWVDTPFSELSCPIWSALYTANTAWDVFVVITAAGIPKLVIGAAAWRNPGSVFTGAPGDFSNATPIVVTAASHNLLNGDIVTVTGVQGNTAANGAWTVANKTATTFELAGSAGNGAFTSGTGCFASRGVGAGTTQLAKVGGIWTNAVTIPVYNNTSLYIIAPGQATYVGSILIDGTAGQVTCQHSWGQSRRWAIWNAYNRKDIVIQVGDSTTSWGYNTATWRASNGDFANTAITFTGLAECPISARFMGHSVGSAGALIGVGYSSITVPSGVTVASASDATAEYTSSPMLGAATVTALEKGVSTHTFYGTQARMQLTVSYKG